MLHCHLYIHTAKFTRILFTQQMKSFWQHLLHADLQIGCSATVAGCKHFHFYRNCAVIFHGTQSAACAQTQT